MVNKVILVGRLGKDPEEKALKDGSTMCIFSVATSESYKDKQGQKVENTEWHRCVAFRNTAEVCVKYLKKGSLVYVEGKLNTRTWETEPGDKKSIVEIVLNSVQFLDSKGSASEDEHSEIPF